MIQHRRGRFLPILLLLMVVLLAFPSAAMAKRIKVKKIKFKKYSGTLVITKGQKLTLKVKITPAKATNKKVKWSTSKKKVVTVTQKGVIRGKKTGTATITVKAKDGSGKKAKLKVKVIPKTTAKKTAPAETKADTASGSGTSAAPGTQTPAAGCKIIAHRGYSSLAPENSLDAIRLALASSYDGVELDVRVTRDKGFLISHDDNLKTLCGEDVSIKTLTLAEATSKKMITGSNLSSYPNATLTSLDQVLALAKNYPDKVLYLELKTAFYLPTLEKLLTLIRSYDMQDRVRLISFYKDNFTNIRSLTALGGDTIELGYLITVPTDQYIKDCIDLKLHPGLAFYSVTRELTDTFHRAGLTVNAWTINQQTMVDRMIQEYGVDSLTCNQLFRK